MYKRNRKYFILAIILLLIGLLSVTHLENKGLKDLNNRQTKEITGLKKEIAQKNREVDSLKNVIDIETDNTKAYINYIDRLREDKRKLLDSNR